MIRKMLNLLHKKCKLGRVRTWSNAKKCKRNLLRFPNCSTKSSFLGNGLGFLLRKVCDVVFLYCYVKKNKKEIEQIHFRAYNNMKKMPFF